jgi:hypothetical protein
MGVVLGILISLWREFKLSFPIGKQSSFLLQVGWFLSNLLPPLFQLITCRMLPYLGGFALNLTNLIEISFDVPLLIGKKCIWLGEIKFVNPKTLVG